jgi:hypothetical protein
MMPTILTGQQSRRFADLDDVDSSYLVAGYSPEKVAARADFFRRG